MIRPLRLKLTAFFTAVTGGILLAMTLLCLFVSEQDIRERTVQSFTGYLDTISSYISSQGAVSSDWLHQVENAGNLSISISDQGVPLHSMRHTQESIARSFQKVRQTAQENYYLSAERIFQGKSCTFLMNDEEGNACLGALAVIGKEDSVVELILLHSLVGMERSILRQRLVVCVGEMLALILLWAFSWYFTGRLLQPIQENQQRQAQFTAAASHELRTPLAAILSAASAMERGDAVQRSFFSGQIQSEGRRMSRLIGDLLTLSSGDSQACTLQKTLVELDILLLEVYENCLFQARERGLTLSIHIPEAEIPPVSLDRERIYQVLAILLDNALSYTPAPGRIQLSLEQRRGRVCILVADTGSGVPDSEKEHIFQRFYRGEKARSDKTHFGLGLSIASQIVQRHRGKLWVRDASLGGAEFVVELPR